MFPSGTGQFGQNYVKLDDGILTQLQDAKELTVTAWVRNDVTDTNSNLRGAVFSFGSDINNMFAFATLNWASARATFVVNGEEMGGQWGNNDNTSLLGNTPGNRPSPLGKWYQVALTMRDVTPEGGAPATIEILYGWGAALQLDHALLHLCPGRADLCLYRDRKQ